MKTQTFDLSIGLFVSIVFHATLIGIFLILKASPETRGDHRVSVLVPMTTVALASSATYSQSSHGAVIDSSHREMKNSSFESPASLPKSTKLSDSMNRDITPVFKSRTKPVYPEQLILEHLQGNVILSATIDEHGTVGSISIVKSDHALLTQAAIDALKESTFSPALKNGKPITAILDEVIYTFAIDH
jgi:TonB family protein